MLKRFVPTLAWLRRTGFVSSGLWLLALGACGRERQGEPAQTSTAYDQLLKTLYRNTVPLVQSIQIAGGTLGNQRIAKALESVAQGVKRGEGISVPLRRCGQFPSLAAHLLSVGEETGKLDEMFTAFIHFALIVDGLFYINTP